jgi:hypothetical protein
MRINKNINNLNLIILNDLRSVPILAALKLRHNIPSSSFLAHNSLFENREYADYTNIAWKAVLKYVLIIFFGLKIIKASAKYLINDECMGLQSSLFSITEDSSATEDKYPNIFGQVKRLAMGSKDVVEFLKKYNKANIYIFNGRTASSYLISKFCVVNNFPLFYYEYAGHCNGFRLFPVAPHASGKLGELICTYYRYGLYNMADLRVASNKLREDKLNSTFSKSNKKDPIMKYDIVIFLGSDFEYTAVDFEICDVKWIGNLNFCKSIIEKYGENSTYAIRCHPNSASDPNWGWLYEELKKSLSEFGCHIDVYGPDVAVDSHKLILDAKRVVTDLSTISLDAIFLGKPVDIFGNTDIKHIYSNSWMNEVSGNYINDAIAEPFSLGHNFLVFRFSYFEKIICRFLFYIHRSFAKYEIWRCACYYKK